MQYEEEMPEKDESEVDEKAHMNDDRVMANNQNLTDALRRTAQTLQEELEKSVLATQILGKFGCLRNWFHCLARPRIIYGDHTILDTATRGSRYGNGHVEAAGQGTRTDRLAG